MKIDLIDECEIAVIGLGYVGLPLAVALAARHKVVGFDIDLTRIEELKDQHDRTGELTGAELSGQPNLFFTGDVEALSDCTCFIVTVPTPIDRWNKPDFSALVSASQLVGGVLKDGDIVIYESTVYPGVTMDICGKELALRSGLSVAVDDEVNEPSFYLGYSPERINPGDESLKIQDIVTLTSGSTPKAAQFVDELYSGIVTAGTFKVSSIEVAEAAKVIENIQRDVNIALVNDLSILFDKLGIDTQEILTAAGTKWNFLPFWPGLVGGHCIGVDPYYLTHKAIEVGHHPEIILAGRRVNEHMSRHIANRVIKLMLNKNIGVLDARILILGVTFKENCPDIRNSKVIDMVSELRSYNCNVDIFDPYVSSQDQLEHVDGNVISEPQLGAYDAIIVAVAHREIVELGIERIHTFGKTSHVVFDVKYAFERAGVDGRL